MCCRCLQPTTESVSRIHESVQHRTDKLMHAKRAEVCCSDTHTNTICLSYMSDMDCNNQVRLCITLEFGYKCSEGVLLPVLMNLAISWSMMTPAVPHAQICEQWCCKRGGPCQSGIRGAMLCCTTHAACLLMPAQSIDVHMWACCLVLPPKSSAAKCIAAST